MGEAREEQRADSIVVADVLTGSSKPALALPDKPSVAVLPFANKSGDPQQDIFAEGLTEDTITELLRFFDLFVIAPNSSFHYRGKSPAVGHKGEDLFEARRDIGHSLAIDPKYARASAALSRSHATGFLNPVDEEFLNPSAIERAYDLVRTALELDPDLPEALAILSNVLAWKTEHDAAISAFERALQINPNFTNSRFSPVFVMAGEFEQAIEAFAAQMRLDPFYSPLTPHWLWLAHYMLGQYSKALPLLVECRSRAPNFLHGHIWLAEPSRFAWSNRVPPCPTRRAASANFSMPSRWNLRRHEVST